MRALLYLTVVLPVAVLALLSFLLMLTIISVRDAIAADAGYAAERNK